jgi:hypothetical protein
MRTMILMMISALILSFTNAGAQNAANATTAPAAKSEPKAKVYGPVAKFDKMTYTFEDLTQGVPSTTTFTLTNDGNEPLIIASANASCGCTSPSYSREPIMPGKSTPLLVTYNAAVQGNFNKSITIRTNASETPVVLMISGKVVPKTQ